MPGLDHFSLLAPLYERFIPPRLPEQLIQLLELPAGGTVLDAGGGTGRLAQFLAPLADQVILLDESLSMTLQARHKTMISPTCGNSECLPFRSQAFQRIMMVDALHHVAHQAQTICELWRVLAPGGIIVIEEPDIRTFGVKLIALAEKAALMRSRFLSPVEIEQLFPFPDARVEVQAQAGAAWVIARRLPG
jgi:demethylmenaquinone methyltransferase/2-methoxy-6-polyprenyl-1,4-benzoquinol methylase